MRDSHDKLVRILVKLKSLKMHLPETLVPEDYVTQYHDVLNSLRQLGYEIEQWKVPDTWMSAISNSGSRQRYVAHGLLLMRLDAVLGLFQAEHSPEKARMPRSGL